MKKAKILKKLPKNNKKYKKNSNFQKKSPEINKFKDNYLNFYDDIKVPTRRYDW